MTNTLMTLSTVDATPALPTASLLGPPAGLTDADADRIVAAFGNARTESTRAVYAGAWRRWERWCASRGIAGLPGEPNRCSVPRMTEPLGCRGLAAGRAAIIPVAARSICPPADEAARAAESRALMSHLYPIAAGNKRRKTQQRHIQWLLRRCDAPS